MVATGVGVPQNGDPNIEAVEAALDAEDFTPLVRMVFDAVASSYTASFTKSTKRKLLARAPQGSAAFEAALQDEAGTDGGYGRRASDWEKALRKEAAAPVLQALDMLIDSRGGELSQICRSNAEEIAVSLQELEAIQRDTQELQMRISSGDAALQDAGSTFLDGLEQLQDLRRLQSSVAASCKAVGAAKLLLNLCAAAGRAISSGELYRAFRLLERAQAECLAPPEAQPMQGPLKSTAANGLDAGTRLHSFLSARVAEMRAAIQQLAIKDFNEWLVSVREQAAPIGMLALRKAAWERQRRQSLLQSRRRLLAELPSVEDPHVAAAALAKPLTLRFSGSAVLDPAAHPAAASLLADGGVNPFGDPLAAVDMAKLHRCLQMHIQLGQLTAFQEYYQVNRRMQLNNDLAVQGNFLAQYKGYLAQLVGFFIIEDRVSRLPDSLSSGQVDAGWETAVTYLKLAIETALATVASATTLLEIKDLVLLVCSILGDCGYHVAPLLDVITVARAKNQALLVAEAGPQVRQAAATGCGAPLNVATPALAAELSDELGLPLGVGGGEQAPKPPFRAPFSAAVPALLRHCRRHVEQSAAYAWGLASPAEVLFMVRQQRDALLLEAVVPALEQALAAPLPANVPASPPASSMGRALQNIADLAALCDSLPALDDHTSSIVRGVPRKPRSNRPASGGPSNGSAAGTLHVNAYSPVLMTKLKELQGQATGQLMVALGAKLREVIGESLPLDWLPDQPVSTAAGHSPYILELIEYLQASLKELAGRLPKGCYHDVGRLLMGQVGSVIMEVLMGDAVPGYNLYSLFRLNDDLLALAHFASTKTDIPHMEDGLLELIQFCDLMVTGRLEDILIGTKCSAEYGDVDLRRLLLLLRKYREVTPKGEHAFRLGRSKQPQSFLKKKTAERVAKQLRHQLDSAAAVATPAAK